jgi:transcriptional regulator of acetoin/glycerol metabolism
LLTPFNNRAGAASSDLRAKTVQSAAERCQVFGLTPGQAPDLHRLAAPQLLELQQRNARLCAQALPVMEMLYEQLTHAKSIVLLTDASGVVLQALGDAGFLERAEQVALAPGALWAEADKGTNAVGTALMTESPTCIFGPEHFLRSLQFLTCAAAPLFDHKGALLGIINVSSDRRAYHPHTQALASLSARLIETQWFSDKFSQHLRLHLHPSSSALGTLHEGVLALDDAGRVLGANRRAIELLGDSAHHLRRSGVQNLFDTNLSGLIDQARRHPEQALLLAFIHQGRPGPAEPMHARLSLGLSLGRMQPQPQSQPQRLRPTGMGMGELADASSAPAAAILLPPPVVLAETWAETEGSAAAAAGPTPAARSATIEPCAEQAQHAGLATQAAPTLRQAELRAIHAAVQHCGGNLAQAARDLGIGRSTLYRKLKSVNAAVEAAAALPSVPPTAPHGEQA